MVLFRLAARLDVRRTVMGRNAGLSESLMGDDRKWQLDGSTGGDDEDGHTTASARERTVWRGF
ncbi:MAG: hypothetical protein JOZ45_19480 [Acidobacteriaceae bacterium]|nr:hypothetical protein [Acidobacteriaceae bacterium]